METKGVDTIYANTSLQRTLHRALSLLFVGDRLKSQGKKILRTQVVRIYKGDTYMNNLIAESINRFEKLSKKFQFRHDLECLTSSSICECVAKIARKKTLKFFKQEITAIAEKTREDTIENITLFLDELEMRQPDDLKTDNWRNWKYIRNSIRDKFLSDKESKS